MDQFAQTNDLQKAIDNVANGGDVANSADNNAPFGIPPMPPMPENGTDMPKVEPLVPVENNTPSAEQILSQSIGTENMPPANNNVPPVPEVAPVTQAPAAEVAPVDNAAGGGAPVESVPVAETNMPPAEDLSEVKQNILKELLPILDKTEKTPEEKFGIYKDAIETMHDVKTIEGAYRTAAQIGDEAKKAEALFDVMKVIDTK